MRRTSAAVVALGVLFVVAACTSDNTTSPPRATTALASSRSVNIAFTCSSNTFSTMSNDAKAYFANHDPVFDSISNMKKLWIASPATAVPTGFNILARTATVRDGGKEIGSAALGGKFVLDVVGCMSTVLPVDTTFHPELALANGVFEVKGGADTVPALAEVAVAHSATTQASPVWGAQPYTNWSRTAAPGYPAYLVFGYPLGADVRTSGFDLGTIPNAVSEKPYVETNFPNYLFRVGLCVNPSNGNNTALNRLIHAGSIVTGFLDPNSQQDQGATFCTQANTIAMMNRTWLQRFASNALSIISPRYAFAMQGLGGGDFGIGGLPDGWSPIVPNSILGNGITLSFGGPVKNTFADTLFDVTITAMDAAGAPVPGVVVTMSVNNNHGVPAGAIIVGDSLPKTTRTSGAVTFHLGVGKAGGFILAANGLVSNVATQSAVSNQFQVQNK